MTRSRTCLAVAVVCLFSWSSFAQEGATYTGVRAGQFLTRWLVLGPLPVFEGKGNAADAETQRKAFDALQIAPESLTPGFESRTVKYANREYGWKLLAEEGHTIDLGRAFGDSSFAIAYAWTQIEMPDTLSTLLGIGSDDGVKVWLNGRLVHSNWIGRAVKEDDDIVPVTFRKGRNELLLKIQNMEQAWAFCVRPIGPEQFTERLSDAAQRGDLDAARLLLVSGASVNTRNAMGLTPLQVAHIAGREEAAKLLTTMGADTSLPMPPPNRLTDNLLASLFSANGSGAAVLVSVGGKIVYEKAVGLADVGKQRPVDVQTRFRIGSVTKQFTAAAILKLQEEGKLSVHDRLAKFIPDFPRGNEVTLYQLLTHTSGMHSYTDQADFITKVTSPVDPDSLVAAIKSYPFNFNPGERWEYCNSGYFLLGSIVGKVSGMSYGEFLTKNFFAPLHMSETGVHTRNAAIPDEAKGHESRNDSVVAALDWDLSWAGGAGALYSTVGDLFRWNEGIFGGKVLRDSSLRAAWTPAVLNDGTAARTGLGGYGFGWMIGKQRGIDLILHGGGLHGFTCNLARYPAEKMTVVVLLNSSDRRNPGEIEQQIAEYYLYGKMEKQDSFAASAAVDPGTYVDYVGRYDYPQGMILTVTKEEDRLYAQLSGQPRFEIFPRRKDEFFWKVVDAQVSFARDARGVVVQATHQQGGVTFTAPKLADEKPVSVDPAVFDTYAGTYEIAPGAVLTVTEEGSRLFVQMTGQPKFEVFPRSETVFFLTAVNASIAFKKAADGKVGSLTLTQGGRETEAKRMK